MYHRRSGSCMRNRLSWILFVSVLGVLTTACNRPQRGDVNAVRLDLGRLSPDKVYDQTQEFVWLRPVASVRALPDSVKARIGRKIVNPEGAFNPGDVRFIDGLFGIADRRLLFAGLSDGYCLMHYEFGGIAHGYMVAVFVISGNKAVPVWVHAGRQYTNLADFANETDPDELTNQVKYDIL